MKTDSLVMEPAEKVLLITRTMDAPPELVFKAWTDCSHLKRWWGPENFTAPECSVDFRVGGTWRICIRSNEGAEHWHHGVYQDIIKDSKIVFSHQWERPDGKGPETTVTVLFEADEAGKTRFSFHQAFMVDAIDRDNHRHGWNGCFDHLVSYIKELN